MSDDPFDFQSPDDFLNDPVGGAYSGGSLADNPTGGFNDISVGDLFSDVADAFQNLSFDFIPDWGNDGSSTDAVSGIGRTGAGSSGASLTAKAAAFARSGIGMITLGIVAGLIVWRLTRRRR